ncbi:hypothetical protein [Poseidonibacter ostreae]|uniref:hypothetical protein n=1 Tax=Poseidonibacter ostreae TaxID=2654171 RepID=UPI00186B550F|nr:hypothetical protein [Poseidonibacter ostreae]
MRDTNTKPNEPFNPEQEKIEYEEYKLKENDVEYKGEQVQLNYKKNTLNSDNTKKMPRK